MRHINHGARIAGIWLVLSIIGELLVAVAPIPSPVGSDQAVGEHQTLYMLFYVGTPVLIFVLVLLIYNMIVFRHRGVDIEDLPSPPDSTPVIFFWAALSFSIVLFLAGWGSFTLFEITSAQSSHPLVVQVIGQQWQWTYRYPSYGGMETHDLILPVHTPIRFDITSLDVVHSFWIYDYDIKEDAVPGVTNHAYFQARTVGSTTVNGRNVVVCNELCGLWHGYMRTKLQVEPMSAFRTWATKYEQFERGNGLLKNLPVYHRVYFPDPVWPSAPQDQSP